MAVDGPLRDPLRVAVASACRAAVRNNHPGPFWHTAWLALGASGNVLIRKVQRGRALYGLVLVSTLNARVPIEEADGVVRAHDLATPTKMQRLALAYLALRVLVAATAVNWWRALRARWEARRG